MQGTRKTELLPSFEPSSDEICDVQAPLVLNEKRQQEKDEVYDFEHCLHSPSWTIMIKDKLSAFNDH